MSAKGRKAETALETLLRLTERHATWWCAERRKVPSVLWRERCQGRVDAYDDTAARIRRLMKREARRAR